MKVTLKITVDTWGTLCSLSGGGFVSLDPANRHSTYIRLDALKSLTCD